MKFICSNCSYEKEIPPAVVAKYVGKNVTCPKCKLKSVVDPNAVAPIQPKSRLRAVSLFCALALGSLLMIAGVVYFSNSFLAQSMSRDNSRPIPPTLVESVKIDSTTTLTATYYFTKIYVPLDKPDRVPLENRRIEVDVVRNGKAIEPTAETFNIDGKPTKLTCNSSNEQICECSVFHGSLSPSSSVYVDPKTPGEVTISIELMGKKVNCNMEFVQVPVRVDQSGLGRAEKLYFTQKMIETIGFPDKKTSVHVEKTGEMVDGYSHNLPGFYEHWRYDKFPKLIIATESDCVVGIMTER